MDYSSSFIGNLVCGGRTGVEPNGAGTIYPYTCENCSGKHMNLYPFLEPTPTNNPDGPGYVAGALGCQLCQCLRQHARFQWKRIYVLGHEHCCFDIGINDFSQA